MDEMSESMNKKSFFSMAAYAAENMSDECIIDHLEKTIQEYQDAKVRDWPAEKLLAINTQISVLSYIKVIKMIDMKATDLISDMSDVDNVWKLIKPDKN